MILRYSDGSIGVKNTLHFVAFCAPLRSRVRGQKYILKLTLVAGYYHVAVNKDATIVITAILTNVKQRKAVISVADS